MKRVASRGNEQKVFDWDKAAKIIKERDVINASAGLIEDLGSTVGNILVDGRIPEKDYTFLSSTWATPVLILGRNNDVFIHCYIMESETEWNSSIFWPKSARKILIGEDDED